MGQAPPELLTCLASLPTRSNQCTSVPSLPTAKHPAVPPTAPLSELWGLSPGWKSEVSRGKLGTPPPSLCAAPTHPPMAAASPGFPHLFLGLSPSSTSPSCPQPSRPGSAWGGGGVGLSPVLPGKSSARTASGSHQRRHTALLHLLPCLPGCWDHSPQATASEICGVCGWIHPATCPSVGTHGHPFCCPPQPLNTRTVAATLTLSGAGDTFLFKAVCLPSSNPSHLP